MSKLTLNIADDFSNTPGPRLPSEGDFSGEEFRTKLLYPLMIKAIEEKKTLTVILDGTEGYATSFLEESFGGLIRENGLNLDDIKRVLEIVSDEEDYLKENIMTYLRKAQDAKNS